MGVSELFSLDGKIAVVTGASSGLGIEFAETLAMAGADLVLMARRDEELKKVANGIRKRFGVRTQAIVADLANREQVTRSFEEIDKRHGRVDVLVNNAGYSATGRAESQWPEAWDKTLDINLSAVFQCSLLARDIMVRESTPGRIINIASIFGHLGSSLFRLSSYAASKGAVENLTRQLAVEWAPDGITVNAIAPAWFESEMTAGSIDNDEIRGRMAAGCPLNRVGKPGELATACLFLAAQASSFVTGTVVPVDGGYSAW